MYCEECGTQLDDEKADFCFNCGTKTPQAGEATQTTQTDSAPTAEPAREEKPFSYCSNCGIEYPNPRETCVQ